MCVSLPSSLEQLQSWLTETEFSPLFSYLLITPEIANKLFHSSLCRWNGVLPTLMHFNSNYIHILTLMPIMMVSEYSPKIQWRVTNITSTLLTEYILCCWSIFSLLSFLLVPFLLLFFTYLYLECFKEIKIEESPILFTRISLYMFSMHD